MFIGRMVENTAPTQLVAAYQSNTAETLYNGNSSSAATGIYVDTMGFDEMVVTLSVGNITGNPSLAVKLLENSTDAISTATVPTATQGGVTVTGQFTSVNTSNCSAIQVGGLLTKYRKRYMWVQTNQTGTGTIPYSITAVLAKADNVPASDVTATPIIFNLYK